MKHWTEYRWDEGTLILISHPDYTEPLYATMTVVSVRFADFYFIVGLTSKEFNNA